AMIARARPRGLDSGFSARPSPVNRIVSSSVDTTPAVHHRLLIGEDLHHTAGNPGEMRGNNHSMVSRSSARGDVASGPSREDAEQPLRGPRSRHGDPLPPNAKPAGNPPAPSC